MGGEGMRFPAASYLRRGGEAGVPEVCQLEGAPLGRQAGSFSPWLGAHLGSTLSEPVCFVGLPVASVYSARQLRGIIASNISRRDRLQYFKTRDIVKNFVDRLESNCGIAS